MGIRRSAVVALCVTLGSVVSCSPDSSQHDDLDGIGHISEMSTPSGSRPTPPAIPSASASLTTAPASPSATATPTSPETTRTSEAPPPPADEPPEDDDPTAPSDSLDDLNSDVVELTNAERTEQGCPELKPDDLLHEAALGHSDDMAERDYFSHQSPEGVGPGERADSAGYDAWGAENIALGYPTAEDVMTGWMNSEGHRKNILNCELTEIGVGVADSAKGKYWTQMFGYG